MRPTPFTPPCESGLQPKAKATKPKCGKTATTLGLKRKKQLSLKRFVQRLPNPFEKSQGHVVVLQSVYGALSEPTSSSKTDCDGSSEMSSIPTQTSLDSPEICSSSPSSRLCESVDNVRKELNQCKSSLSTLQALTHSLASGGSVVTPEMACGVPTEEMQKDFHNALQTSEWNRLQAIPTPFRQPLSGPTPESLIGDSHIDREIVCEMHKCYVESSFGPMEEIDFPNEKLLTFMGDEPLSLEYVYVKQLQDDLRRIELSRAKDLKTLLWNIYSTTGDNGALFVEYACRNLNECYPPDCSINNHLSRLRCLIHAHNVLHKAGFASIESPIKLPSWIHTI